MFNYEKMKISFLYFITIFLVLTGCTKIENIKNFPSQGNKFQQYLTKYYIELAESEAEQYDWIDSQHFAAKAMYVAHGKTPEPEDPKHWNIPKTILPSLLNARIQLLKYLTPENIKNYPETLAKAQYAFDAWVEEQEENWQIEKIEECRENFYLALNNIIDKNTKAKDKEEVKSKKKKGNLKESKEGKNKVKPLNNKKAKSKFENNINKKSSKKVKAKPKIVSKKPDATSALKKADKKKLVSSNLPKNNIKLSADDYKIIFKPSSVEFSAMTNERLKNILAYINSNPKCEIIINSYSKAMNNDNDNLKLSKERALFIKNKLIKAGAFENNITIFAFGNSEAEELNNINPNLIELYLAE
ncbi:MAG: OmpA family protein [Alphaproteobacteria bacterium]